MKNEWKIPFKKLEWHSGVTKEGEEKGYVHQIGEFWQERARHPERRYYVTNHKDFSDILTVWSSDDDKLLGEVTSIEKGKEICQKDFESYVMKTYFENDGIPI